jgi:serine/threonine-protein kinase
VLSHPGVVHLYDQGEVRGRHYFAMELVRGTTLKDRVQMQGPLSVAELTRLTLEMCEALAHVHEHGVVHRDLKPENIMLMSDGSARLMDFGIAQMIGGSAAAATGGFQGSPAYMSPEQVQGKPVDRRSDIYSLGITLYEAATGRRAVEGETIPVIAHQVANEFPPPPTGLPQFLQVVLMRALTKDPEKRYQYASEMAADIRAAQAGLPLSRRPGASAPPPPEPEHAAPAPAYLGSLPEKDPVAMAQAVTATTAPSLGEFAGNLIPPTPPPPACRAHAGAASTALCTQCRSPICYTCLVETPTRGIICRGCAYPRV